MPVYCFIYRKIKVCFFFLFLANKSYYFPALFYQGYIQNPGLAMPIYDSRKFDEILP